MTLNKTQINNVISIWKDKFGIDRTSKNGTTYKIIPNSTKERQEALINLVAALKEMFDYRVEDFTLLLRNDIIDNCTYSKWEDRIGLHQWQKSVGRDLDIAINLVFGDPVKFETNIGRKQMSEVKELEKVRFGDYPTIPLKLHIATSIISGTTATWMKWAGPMDADERQTLAKEALELADELIKQYNSSIPKEEDSR